jgi:hypothetical protein
MAESFKLLVLVDQVSWAYGIPSGKSIMAS